MKKIALVTLIIILTLTSCSLDDGQSGHDFYLEVMPIESVEVPEYFVLGETYQINVTYIQPSNCYYFNDFIYEINGQQRTVAVVNTVYNIDNNTCAEEPEEVTVHFDFQVNASDTYLFKFYQGEDENGEDQYYLVEVPVMDGRAISDGIVKD